ncbi:MAG TPA: division/cell wall cluster transcriptional repressor MraZ [Xanthomonadaceae bacterium]|nr:division/cell wall cluster transcriptional repressor MraZ [Xanthomonadaceae bacterium]
MFQGESIVSLDEKGRMAIPSAYREQITAICRNRLVVAYNPFDAGCLWLFPEGEWERVRDQVNGLPSFQPGHRLLQRKLVGAASHVEPDASFRILLPASARQICGLEKRAVLIGLGAKFELWSEEAHRLQIGAPIAEAQLTDDMLKLRF